ncbi:MAG: phosphoenolpyruvate synthase, partial [Thermoplasmata archaeon]|nr:phosphoenolpyruvate synthase [Thermoplasmata archaeon]
MPLVVNLADVSDSDLPLVGGKASKLGEVVRQGLPVPPGIVVTTDAYRAFVEQTTVGTILEESLTALDLSQGEAVDAASRRIREAFESTAFPPALKEAIVAAYEKFSADEGIRFVAVRSSATAEDLEGASFAGLQETYLNIRGTEAVLDAIRRCWGSLFTPRVLIYRAKKGFDHRAVRLAVLVQKMVDSVVSGILFTRDPNTGENHMIIEAGFGLGEAIVGGEVTPDHYVVDGVSHRIVVKQLSDQAFQIVRAEEGGNKRVDLPEVDRKRQKLPDEKIHRLASLARVIESHYRRPMDVEWCADDRSLYIVQARPVTTIPALDAGKPPGSPTPSNAPFGGAPPSSADTEPIVRGFGASPGIAGGTARLLRTSQEMERLKPGEILITTMTTPDMVPAMAQAAGIVTDEGGITCHAAIVSRELGVPCVVGTRTATKMIPDGETVSVDGKAGAVYRGLAFSKAAATAASAAATSSGGGHGGGSDHSHVPVTATKVFVN